MNFDDHRNLLLNFIILYQIINNEEGEKFIICDAMLGPIFVYFKALNRGCIDVIRRDERLI